MKKYVAIIFQVLLFLMVAAPCAFADLIPEPEPSQKSDDDSSCAAYPLSQSSQLNVFTALIVLLAVAGASGFAIRNINKN